MESMDQSEQSFGILEQRLKAKETFMEDKASEVMNNYVGEDFGLVYNNFSNLNELLRYYVEYGIKKRPMQLDDDDSRSMKQKFGEMDPSWSLFEFVRSRVNDRNYFCNLLAELILKFDILREDVQQLPPLRQHFEEEKKNNGMFH